MKYLFSDYDVFRGITLRRDVHLPLDNYILTFSRLHGNLITPDCIIHALRGLASGGLIHVEAPNGIIDRYTCTVALTEEGRLWRTEVNGKDPIRNELEFCTMDRPAVTVGEEWVAQFPFSDACKCHEFYKESRIYPTFTFEPLDTDRFLLTLHHPAHLHSCDLDFDPDEVLHPFVLPDNGKKTASAYSVSLTVTREQATAFLTELLDAATEFFRCSHGVGKITITGREASLLLTVKSYPLPVKPQCVMTATVLSDSAVAKDNKDSPLTFRKGEKVMIIHKKKSSDFVYDCVLRSAVSCPSLLTEELCLRIGTLHRVVLPFIKRFSYE